MVKLKQTIASLIVGLGMTLLFQNCGQGFTAASGGASEASSSQSATSTPTTAAPVAQFAATSSAALPMNLGVMQSLTVTLNPAFGFTGLVNIAIDGTALAAVDPLKNVQASLSQSSIMLGGNQPSTITLTLHAPVTSPTVNTYVDLVVTEANPPSGRAAYSTKARVMVQTVAVYDIFLTSPAGAQEVWQDINKATIPAVINFATHTEGITINFHNMDAGPHRIHSSAQAFPHQPADMASGQMYTVKVTTQTPTANTYYCHDHEQITRMMNFNATAGAVTTTTLPTSGNPNAKYSYLAANILPKCVGCHSGAGAAKGIDFSSYAKTTALQTVVLPKNAAGSSFYTATANGSMPQGGSPLTAAEVQDIKDWINDGALNN